MNTMTIGKTPQPLPRPFVAAMRLDPQKKIVIHHNMPIQPAPSYETRQ
jgi:hypothetical protein